MHPRQSCFRLDFIKSLSLDWSTSFHIYTIYLYYITRLYSTVHNILLVFGAALAFSRFFYVDAYSFRQQATGEELKSLDKKLEVACGFGEVAHDGM